MTNSYIKNVEDLLCATTNAINDDLMKLGCAPPDTSESPARAQMARFDEDLENSHEADRPGLRRMWGRINELRREEGIVKASRIQPILERWRGSHPELAALDFPVSVEATTLTLARIALTLRSCRDDPDATVLLLVRDSEGTFARWQDATESFDLLLIASQAAADSDAFVDCASLVGNRLVDDLFADRIFLPGFDLEHRNPGSRIRCTLRSAVVEREPENAITAEEQALSSVESDLQDRFPTIHALQDDLWAGFQLLDIEDPVRARCLLSGLKSELNEYAGVLNPLLRFVKGMETMCFQPRANLVDLIPLGTGTPALVETPPAGIRIPVISAESTYHQALTSDDFHESGAPKLVRSHDAVRWRATLSRSYPDAKLFVLAADGSGFLPGSIFPVDDEEVVCHAVDSVWGLYHEPSENRYVIDAEVVDSSPSPHTAFVDLSRAFILVGS